MTPKIQAEIALKAIKIRNLREIACEYRTSEFVVQQLQSILEDNAEHFFQFISGDDSPFQALNTIRDQLDTIQESLEEITEAIRDQLEVIQESLDEIAETVWINNRGNDGIHDV